MSLKVREVVSEWRQIPGVTDGWRPQRFYDKRSGMLDVYMIALIKGLFKPRLPSSSSRSRPSMF